MTLDEAIAHAKEVAKENYLQGMLCHANPNDSELDKCIECGREHEQLAEWLQELKLYREIGTLEEVKESIEKQHPKKPDKSGVIGNDGIFHEINGINGVPYDLCPNCGKNLCTDGIFGRDKKFMKYCEYCGQKLDWSKE